MRCSLLVLSNLWLVLAQPNSLNVQLSGSDVRYPRSVVSRYCTPDQTNELHAILSEVAQWCFHAQIAADEANVDDADHKIFRWLFLRERPNELWREGWDVARSRTIVQRRFHQIQAEALQSPHAQILISCSDNYDVCDETDLDAAFAHPLVDRNIIVLVGPRPMKNVAAPPGDELANMA
ncbi:MAG: hypothetical protein Q9160_006031 [Pyrenula sp. 1 TL-2023]